MSPPLCPFHSAVTPFQGFCLSSQKQVTPRQQVPYNPPTLEALQDMTLLQHLGLCWVHRPFNICPIDILLGQWRQTLSVDEVALKHTPSIFFFLSCPMVLSKQCGIFGRWVSVISRTVFSCDLGV